MSHLHEKSYGPRNNATRYKHLYMRNVLGAPFSHVFLKTARRGILSPDTPFPIQQEASDEQSTLRFMHSPSPKLLRTGKAGDNEMCVFKNLTLHGFGFIIRIGGAWLSKPRHITLFVGEGQRAIFEIDHDNAALGQGAE